MSKINILEALRVSLTSIKNYINKNYYNTSEIDELLNEIELTPGPKGDKGNDGLTTSIIVNGATYNHSNGTITLPNYPSIDGLATETYVDDAVSGLSNNLQGQIDGLFQNVSNGKELIASAITDKGVDASEEETFQSLSEKINQIPVGPPGSNIIGYINENNDIYVSLTELENGTYTLKFEDYTGLLNEFDDIGTVEV